MVQERLKVNTLSKGSVLKLHSLVFVGVKLQDAVSLYSRVEINTEQLKNLQILCQQFFNVFCLFRTIWAVGVAIPYHTSQLKEKLGYGLGLHSMQGREAKHVKLARYVQNTCNVKKSSRWWTVFRHEFVSMVWLRERDPYSITYRSENKNSSDLYIPKRLKDNKFCHCGQSKLDANVEGCPICMSDIMQSIKHSVFQGRVSSNLKTMLDTI